MLDYRPVLPRWIVWVTSSNHSATARFERKKYRSAPALDQSDTQSALVGNWKIHAMQADWQVTHYPHRETDRFRDFIEAHGHPCGDIALVTHGFLGRHVTVRLTRSVATKIERFAARNAFDAA